MEETIPQNNSKTIWITIIISIIVLVSACVSIYLWQQSDLINVKANYTKQMSSLEKEISDLQKNNLDLQQAQKETNLKLPAIAFGRPGLLTTDEGKKEKEILEKKLINPYIDYKNDTGELISMFITVPENIGEPYDVVAIFKGENLNGHEGFLFGKREQEYDYWKPDCMGECEFTDEYKAKYPEVVQ